jgi:DNA polymerase-4
MPLKDFACGRRCSLVAHETRSLTLPAPPSSCDELTGIALALRERVEMGSKQLFRLVGVGLSNFQSAEDPVSPLFDEEPAEDQ